jgi:hypothetical protein
MAATSTVLATATVIQYEVLRKVSDHFMSIPSFALPEVLRVLDEIGFVRLVEQGRKIISVLPSIPIFEDVYPGIGNYASATCSFNEHEQITLALLSQLQSAPRNRDALFNDLGARGGETETDERYCEAHEIETLYEVVMMLPVGAGHLKSQPINLIPWILAKEVPPFSHPSHSKFPQKPSGHGK